MTKRVALLSAFLAAALGAAACSDNNTGGSGNTPAPGGGTKHKITLIQGLTGEAFYITMQCGAQAEAAALGNVDLNTQGPTKFAPEQQTPVLTGVVAQRPEAILIAPTHATAMFAPLAAAQAQGIKIVLVDTIVTDPSIGVSRISSNNEDAGKQAAQALAQLVGDKGKVLVVTTDPGVSTTDARVKGFQDEIRNNHPNMSYVGGQYGHNDTAQSQQVINASLAKDPDLAGVFATNLNSSTGVAAGLKAAGKTSVKMVGFDAGADQIKQLQEGTVQALVAQKPADMGKEGIDQAVAAIEGKPVTASISTGFVTITQQNMNDPEIKKSYYTSTCS